MSSCIEGGTHGSISEYCYAVRQSDLRLAVDKTIELNSAVLQRGDTTRSVLIYLQDGRADTVLSNHPNSLAYTDVRIVHENSVYEYRVQYVGTELSWDTSKTSCLSLAYAFDEEGRGGSNGDGGISWSTPLLKQKLLAVFEKEFIQKIDSALAASKP
jgi:hypothetical protein